MYYSNLSLATFFFFENPAPTEIYTLSLHDALPIRRRVSSARWPGPASRATARTASTRARRVSTFRRTSASPRTARSEEHTSELQSRLHLVCRLLLEKKITIQSRIRCYLKLPTSDRI